MSIIKSFSVKEGDQFYIKHDTDNFTMIDCNMDDGTHGGDKVAIVKELKAESAGKGITRFISTHPDDDHIMGLKYLDEQLNLLNFYCVENKATKKKECWTEDFGHYCKLRDDEKKHFYVYRDCSRKWMNQSDDERGSSGINIRWPITSNADYREALQKAAEGESPNNISPIIQYTLIDGAEVIWMGDLENSFQEKIKNTITLPSIDILFAPHHGRDSGKVVKEWMEQMAPNLVVIGEAPSKDLNYYSGYNTITQNSAGDIVFDCDIGKTHIYVSNKDYSVTFLDNEKKPNAYGCKYIGTLQAKAAKKKAAGA